MSNFWAEDGSDHGVVEHVARALARPGPKSIAVAGGSTPKPILAELAARPLRWTEYTITPTDERVVPGDHPASNLRELRAALGRTGAGLRALEPGMVPGRFDLVWLGVGNDGHVASIFPAPRLDPELEAKVVGLRPDPLPPEAPYRRLTLTYAALVDTPDLILVARGPDKRAVIEAAIEGVDCPLRELLARAARATIFWSRT